MIKEFSIDDFPKCNDLFVQVFNGAPWHDKWTTDPGMSVSFCYAGFFQR